MKFMGRKTQLDRYGEMPSLKDMLQMRKNQQAYRFYWMVFAPLVYGQDNFRKDVFAPFMSVERARKVYTESDEAWGMLVLEDNWDVWWNKAAQEYDEYMTEINDVYVQRHLDQPSIVLNGRAFTEESETLTWTNYRNSGGTSKRVNLPQLYSSKKTMGLSQYGYDRLEVLEEMVHEDRMEDGKVFYEHIKCKYLIDQGEQLKSVADENMPKTRVLRMM